MRGVVVGHIPWPARRIQAERDGVVLVHDETPLGGRMHRSIVGEGPCAGHNHVAFETQDGFKNLVPHLERNAGLVALFRRDPSGEQILIVGEKAAIAEHRLGEDVSEIGWKSDGDAPGRHLVGPQIHGIDAEIALREFVDGVDGSAHVSARKADHAAMCWTNSGACD